MHGRAWALTCLVAGIFAYLFGPNLVAHWLRSTTTSYVNDDVRQQIFPFFRFEEPHLFENDYIAQYYLNIIPILYRGLYFAAACLGATVTLSKLLPYALLGVVVVFAAACARRLSGNTAAVTAAALVLGNPVYLQRMAGGLPRSFAFPAVAALLYLLASGNALALAVLTCVLAGFYPVVSLIAGLCLSVWLLILPDRFRGRARHWSILTRLSVLSLTAIGTLIIFIPQGFRTRAYGRIISVTRLAEFPEIGPGGRYIHEDRAPFPSVLDAWHSVTHSTLFAPSNTDWQRPLSLLDSPEAFSNDTLASLVLLALGLALLFAKQKRSEHLRFAILPVCVTAAYLISALVAPHLFLPQRYVAYTVPLVLTILLPASVAQLCSKASWLNTSARQLFGLGCAALLFLQFGGRGSVKAGLGTPIHRDSAALHAIGRLPRDALVCAWPAGLANEIPYAARRRVLTSLETHQAFHEQYTLEMRRRVNAIIDAYAATTIEPVLRLGQEFGVTHLVLTNEFSNGTHPSYFRPFQQRIKAASQTLEKKNPIVYSLLPTAAIYNDGTTAIIDLRRLSPR